MRRLLCGAVLLLLALFVLPGFAQDEKKDPKTEKKVEPKKEEKKDNGMVKVGQIVAQIVTLDESKKSMRLRYDVPKLNTGAVQALAQAQLDLARATSVQAAQSAQQRILQQQANLYTKASEEVELATTDDFVVRQKDPPPKFDDKGKLAKYTTKELAEMRGESKLPGFKAEFSDLRTNQVIQVTLMRNRNLPKPKINPKTREIDPDTIADLKPHISFILILGEPRTPGG